MKSLVLTMVLAVTATAQVWSGSGSNGSDGALNLGANTPGVSAGVLIFDPIALNLDADADNIYHFTTITISGGITVQFRANRMKRPGPVIFLASGAVAISGSLNFNGDAGHPPTNNDSVRRISIPGPGGYPGGIGARNGGTPPTKGLGPGGADLGNAQNYGGCPGAYTVPGVPSWCSAQTAALPYGTDLVQPLVGGSGGSGSRVANNTGGGGGGAGGGAFRLSSSVSIVFGTGLSAQNAAQGCSGNYNIAAEGGDAGLIIQYGQDSGSGAGGAIHIQAPVIAGCATHLIARGGSMPEFGRAAEGRIRIDSRTINGIASVPVATSNALVDAPAPPNQPFLRLVTINGVAVPATPQFDYATPDVLINSTSPVPIVLQANNIPVNTPVTLFLTTDTGTDITTTVNLTGTLAVSNATTNVTLPLGTARVIARAIW